MNKFTGNLVRRNVGNVVGVLMSSAAVNEKNTEFVCQVAFGFLSMADALASSSHTKWSEVNSKHIELIAQKMS